MNSKHLPCKLATVQMTGSRDLGNHGSIINNYAISDVSPVTRPTPIHPSKAVHSVSPPWSLPRTPTPPWTKIINAVLRCQNRARSTARRPKVHLTMHSRDSSDVVAMPDASESFIKRKWIQGSSSRWRTTHLLVSKRRKWSSTIIVLFYSVIRNQMNGET